MPSSSSSSLTCTKVTLLTASAVVIQIIGLSLFVFGFFPVKPTLSGMSGLESFYPPGSDSSEFPNVSSLPPEQLKSSYQELSGVRPLFDRLILMVIDGLPAEFVLGRDGKPPPNHIIDAMPYTHSLLAKGIAIGYHSKAAPPTVTMPRLKAMVSGAIGGFLDVAFNFNTQALLDDNLIGQFSQIGWRMVMLGDETWIKLFPGMFTRHDGVSSFFVKDTVQVDHNVSRHLDNELKSRDWDLLILHYLGLDHVGHIGGRNSKLMAPKLKEMDEVIKTIHLSSVQLQEHGLGRTLLVVASDHGMTESGNHGGSSYEETDSLALFLAPKGFDYASAPHKTALQVSQVDLAPTLALLFGVPIPKNNVGMLMGEVFKSLTDDEQLRVLEMNSWQLLRLLEAQSPDLACESFSSCDVSSNHGSGPSKFDDICCSYRDAAALHKSWKSKKTVRSMNEDDYSSIVFSYLDFLGRASEWLSRSATEKPVGLLALGLATMLLSCSVFLVLLFILWKDITKGSQRHSHYHKNINYWHLDEVFTLFGVFILVLSMGSSSMVEEEQYIWHFLTSSLYFLLLHKTFKSITAATMQNAPGVIRRQAKCYWQLFHILVILISSRLLRGWHQGGVNWAYLPDISKWLEQKGSSYIKSLQMISGLSVISISLLTLWSSLIPRRNFVLAISLVYTFPGVLVLYYVFKYQESKFPESSQGSTRLAQMIYTTLGITTSGTAISVPWLMLQKSNNANYNYSSTDDIKCDLEKKLLIEGFKDSTKVIGWAYITSWCLLQLLLQQSINSIPVLLLLSQLMASVCYFSSSDGLHEQWVEVAALYFLGMAGHFGLGNTNTLATIDVAGAFIGVSSHSTLASGILMFTSTYASPILFLISIVMYTSSKVSSSSVIAKDVDFGHFLKITFGIPCLVPLGLNSILLVAYTIVLLQMRHHLFVWSVFSPKYLYVCATTACVCICSAVVASTMIYTSMAFALPRWSHAFYRSDSMDNKVGH